MTRMEALRGGWRPILLYGLLALLSFPTLGHLLAGQNGLAYAHDVFEVPRTGRCRSTCQVASSGA